MQLMSESVHKNLGIGFQKKIKGSKIETSDPIKGMKLRINESKPNVGAKSFFKKYKTMNVEKPVKKLVKNFI